MKPSHFSAPRTLAECQFTTGYVSRPDERSEKRCDFCIALIAVAVCALIVFGVI
jgi:hypothetical protein